MTIKASAMLLMACVSLQAVIVDRIALIAGAKIIKDSDILEDLRLTEFLNHAPLAATPALRKQAADRLIDQETIRSEIEAGGYPKASVEEARRNLDSVIKSGYGNESAYKKALAVYGVSEEELKERLQWQLTVLRFIDLRFRTSASVSDDQIRQYYEAHKQVFPSGLDASRAKINELLAGEQTNKEFYDWLDRRRKAMAIKFLEGGLQ